MLGGYTREGDRDRGGEWDVGDREHGEQNYRPSPITGSDSIGYSRRGGDPFDSHLRHYHRPYPTIRGGQSSPSISPMVHRGPKSPSVHMDDGGVGHSDNHVRMESSSSGERHYYESSSSIPSSTRYSDPHNYLPRHHPYSKDSYHYGAPPHSHHSQPSMYMSTGQNFYSPYDDQQLGHMDMMKSSSTGGHGRNMQHASYAQYPHQHPQMPPGTLHHIHQTPVNQVPYKQIHLDDEKQSKKGSSKNQRRKKMYSDYVGVTYNKTHAKFQACITHYRKQHYLGRYKLAVDAARAYDKSAKLLKGESWKINFKTDEDYEIAKAREIEMIERSRMECLENGIGHGEGVMMHYNRTSRIAKEKLGLRMSMTRDPALVAEKMLQDRLTAVEKQAADHAEKLKQNGVDLTKKGRHNINTPSTIADTEADKSTEVRNIRNLDLFLPCWI